MAHETNGGSDFANLETMDLPDDVKQSVIQARIEARTIIEHLEPQHITSWTDFLERLERSYQRARQAAQVVGGIDIKKFDAQKRQ